MSITTLYSPASYQGDGVSTAFVIPWQFQFAADLVVSTTVVATGVVTLLVQGTNYSVSPASNSPAATGTVLLTVALPAGTDLTIARSTDVTQSSRWVPNFANPANLYEDAVDKLTMIEQEINYALTQISTSPATAVVTTAIFTIAPIGSSQNVSVTSVVTFAVGNVLQISNVTNTIIGQVTAINATQPIMAIRTLAITAGVSGNTMPIGSSVQFGIVPGTGTTIQVADAAISPSSLTTMTFTGSTAGAAAAPGTNVGSIAKVKLYINPFTAGDGTVLGYFDSFVAPAQLGRGSVQSGGSILGTVAGATSGQVAEFFDFTGNRVLVTGFDGTPIFSQVGAGMISANAILPEALIATNSPADGQVSSFDLATGHFTWVNPGGTGTLPIGGNAGQFLNGTPAWTQWLNTSLGDGAFFFGNSTATNAYAGYLTQNFSTPAGANIAIGIGVAKFNGTHWAGSSNGVFNIGGGIAAKIGAGGTYVSIDSALVESGIFGNTASANFITDYVRACGFRSGAGYWQYAFTVTGLSGAITVDFKDGSYQRHTSIAGDVTITLADTTPAPTATGFQYANELTLEINAPGAFVYNWPGTVTWANGASAPVLSTTGINILKFVRRQGQTQWIGCIINPVAGGSSYTDAQARAAVLSATYLLPGSGIAWAITPGVSAAPSIAALGVTNAMLAGSIAASKLLGFPSNSAVFLNGGGTWTVPAGGGGSFSPATTYNWTAQQNFGIGNTYTGTNTFNFTGGGVTAVVAVNGASPITGNQSGASIYMTGPDGARSTLSTYYLLNSSTAQGINAIENILDLTANLTTSTSFFIGQTQIVTSRRLNNGGVSADAAWFNSWGPNQAYAASPDAQGIIHTWTAGGTRIGELNYGNAWADFGLAENRGALGSRHAIGLEFFPDHLPGTTITGSQVYPYYGKFNAQWAICVGYAVPGNDNFNPQNWIGYLSEQNAISPGGYAMRLWGSVGAFSTRIGGIGASAATNAPHAIIKASGTTNIGIDFAGTYDDNVALTVVPETVSGHSNQPAIQLAGGHAICFRKPTGANTGTYIMDDGTHFRVTRDGGNTWTNLI